MSVEYEKHLKLLPALVVLFVALMGSIVLLFFIDKTDMRTGQSSSYITSVGHKSIYGNSESRLPRSSLPLVASNSSRPEIAVLDNDQDHDGNYDGVSDPLAVVGSVLVVLSISFAFRPLVGGRLLLVICQLLKLSSVRLRALERPG